ncbi:MAG: DUF2950 domain-containing protein [Thiobacillaceae bacterium]
MNAHRPYSHVACALAVVLTIFATAVGSAPAAHARPTESLAPQLFATPADAGRALYQAAKANKVPALRAVLGHGSGRIINSGDPEEDAQGRARFVTAYERGAHIEMHGKAKAILVLGEHDWPFPFPLIKSGKQWRFDTRAGRDEVLARRIGRNELSTIQAALAYVDAQRDYALRSATKNGEQSYAQRFVSLPEAHDGLYWQTGLGETPSPMGPLFASAAHEGTPGTLTAPYHGYYFRIVYAQGPHAPGGVTDYIVKGKMIGGFALVAYPARYRASGVKTFIVNHDGIVYSKDLGPDTGAIAQAIERYDPDSSWHRETAEGKPAGQ